MPQAVAFVPFAADPELLMWASQSRLPALGPANSLSDVSEKVVIFAHGNATSTKLYGSGNPGPSVGAGELVRILRRAGLRSNVRTIEIRACEAAANPEGFANQFRAALKPHFPKVTVRAYGLSVTAPDTRGQQFEVSTDPGSRRAVAPIGSSSLSTRAGYQSGSRAPRDSGSRTARRKK